jgi:hypothetical protein
VTALPMVLPMPAIGTRLTPIGHEPIRFANGGTSDALFSKCPDERIGKFWPKAA